MKSLKSFRPGRMTAHAIHNFSGVNERERCAHDADVAVVLNQIFRTHNTYIIRDYDDFVYRHRSNEQKQKLFIKCDSAALRSPRVVPTALCIFDVSGFRICFAHDKVLERRL